MFHAPHDYQVILKLRLQEGKTLSAYKAARKSFSGIFTLVPETLDLTQVISGAKSEFIAEIFKGHFEQGGESLGSLNVIVEKVIFSAKLDPQASEGPANYLVFGSHGEYFAAHLIGGKPNYDMILSVTQPYSIAVPHCGTSRCGDFVTDNLVPLTLAGPGKAQVGDILGNRSGPTARVISSIYFEEADLED
jgi:hypothetical protein